MLPIVLLLEIIQGAQVLHVESDPGLALPAPMEQAHRTWVERLAAPVPVVTAKPVLVPSVVHCLHDAGEHKQEQRHRTQLVDLLLLLELHPNLDLALVMTHLPFISLSGIRKVPQVYSFWKWGALILALVATFSCVITRIKLLVLRFCKDKFLPSLGPQWTQQLDEDDDEYQSCFSDSSKNDEEDDKLSSVPSLCLPLFKSNLS